MTVLLSGTDPRRDDGIELCNLTAFFIFSLFLHTYLKSIDDDGDERKEKELKAKGEKHFRVKSEIERDQRNVITENRRKTGKEKL